MKQPIRSFSYLVIACCMLISGCNKKEKESVKETYPSGKLKKSGWLNKDKVLVDTTIYYFENGNYERIEVRDDSGSLNGISKTFNEDGTIYQEIPYVNNSIEGFIVSYKEGGRISSKAWQVKGRQIGDAYWYDESGQLYQYGFNGFGEGHRNYIKYDNTGKIVEKIAPFIFTDSISVYTPGNSDQKLYEVFLLLSNAPKCRTSVLINYLAKDSTVIKQDSITGRSWYARKESFAKDIYSINFYGKQFDSLTGKNLSQNMTKPVHDF